MRRCRTETEPEPWIEQLIQNYGKSPREISVRAHVVGVSDLSESQHTDENNACMLFLSDGTVFIPAVLSTAAWERLQELEERETFSGLDNTTVSLRKFHLSFHMDTELTSCQFYLSVNQIITVGRVTRHHRPPSCTMLPSVRHHILKTWRSLIKECSVSSLNSQSGFPLSCLMGAWHNDIIMELLNDAIKKIAPPTVCPQGVATPTNWHQERLHCRGEKCFSTPVSHLFIPEDQKELLTADPAQGQVRDLPSMAFDRSENGDLPTMAYTRPVSQEVWCCDGGGNEERVSPWDMFCPAPDLLGTPSSSSETSVEPNSQHDSQSLLTAPLQVPIAASTQVQTSSTSTVDGSGDIILPHQRPHSSLHSFTLICDKTTTDVNQEEQHMSTPPPLMAKKKVQCSQEKSLINSSHIKTHLVSTSAERGQVHTDSSVFSYTYKPCPQVVSALSHFKVPEQMMQWAVAYIGTPHHSLILKG
ncbi:adrenocortical dysplasia protein homolog isoform X2 [Trichomycterus rosablanca]|uniref:adrenocortical dysplasia protein homolog isoform X2 n=1 Tax=Trichomycterus rosablanca TaxID=2290929 RepID=UPI002F351340